MSRSFGDGAETEGVFGVLGLFAAVFQVFLGLFPPLRPTIAV